ncbi:unnamed protein product, partial [Iphiclides podalirius]
MHGNPESTLVDTRFLVSFLLIVLKGFDGPWYGFFFRFVLLFSYIVPISLRVNLEMGKAFYSWTIQRDKRIEGTVMRSTTIPEELGRIQYLLADKTGTLTKNEMVFQKLHLGNALFDRNNFHEIEAFLTQFVTNDAPSLPTSPSGQQGEVLAPTPRQIWEVVLAIALCHNVTPVYDIEDQRADEAQSDMGSSMMSESCGGAVPQQQLCDYQAASPDEVALVKWTDMMGVSLYRRDLHNISLKLRAANEIMQFNILQVFPFTSESKMMGIIVQEENTGAITYYVKGADVALSKLLHSSWLSTECNKLAADGLRTLVVAKKTMSKNEYLEFESEYKEARLSVTNRSERTAAALARLQRGLALLGLTGVEDRLAEDVPRTLAMLRQAHVKVWMLTGDKLETALCIARSLQLGGGSRWLVASECSTRRDAHALLNAIDRAEDGTDLIIEGETLEVCLRAYEEEFVGVLQRCAGVVVARCSPTQKARVARLLRARGHVVAAVGDGGNDVAMIQEADIGVGIEGAEGRAASLAGDVSVRAFGGVARLLLVHGRRAVMRSAALCLFIVHRGLIVSTMQAVFSVVFYFSSLSLYPGFLMVGYGTVFTMLPVFSLVLDKDIPSTTALRYPQLYRQLSKGRQLSYKTFYIWVIISIYQGGVIMYGALVLFEDQLIHIVEISYTALILTELIMVALTVVTWHRLMVLAELLSLAMYTATLLIFTTYFDGDFIRHWDFWWKVTTITLVSCMPLYIVKHMHRKWRDRQCMGDMLWVDFT